MSMRSHLLGGALARVVGDNLARTAEPIVELPVRTPVPARVAAAIAGQRLSEFELDYDAEERLLWASFNFTGRPCFTPKVLEQTQQVQRLGRSLATDAPGEDTALRYIVMNSRTPGVWNLGGDLELFAELIGRRDRQALTRYARLCCDLTFSNATVFDLPVITIALVQGDALGGGFEAALSFNFIIAERGARFGLPEVLFNLFPGMGAYSFLSRRVAPGLAERMIVSGEIYTAEDLYERGVVDLLAPDGEGVEAVYNYIGRKGRRHPTLAAVREARRIANPITLEEMFRISDLWVDAALQLSDSDLRRMLRLAAAQDRRRSRQVAGL
jgi:DSF synthase